MDRHSEISEFDLLKDEHKFGLFFIGPILIVILLITLSSASFSNSKASTQCNLSYPFLVTVQMWSAVLIASCFSCAFYSSEHISLPMMAISILLGLSGILSQHKISRLFFHISTTCSWYGIFDMYVRSNPSTGINTLLSPGWLTAFYMCSAPILRIHMGCAWQIKTPAYMTVGLVFLLSYFWTVELPSCAFSFLSSARICDVMGHTPLRFAGEIFYYDYRLIGMFIAICLHGLTALLLYSFIVEDSEPSGTVKTITENENDYTEDSVAEKLLSDGTEYELQGETSGPSCVMSSSTRRYIGDNSSTESTAANSRVGYDSRRKVDQSNTPKSTSSNTPTGIGNTKHSSNSMMNNSSYKSSSSSTPHSGSIPGTSTASSSKLGGSVDIKASPAVDKINRSPHQVFSIPEDCVEITEEEAIRIVERGLRKFKTMRAN